jgi:hypothetical protein
MSDKVQHILADLEAIAASISDPATREEVQEIIARLSHRTLECPDDANLTRLRLKCNGGPN